MMCYMAAVPMLDAAALQLSARDGTSSGRLRAWGTVGFLMMMVGTGYTALWFGPMASLPLFVGIGVMRALVALGLPAFRAPADAPRPGNAPQPGNATPSGDAPPPGDAPRCGEPVGLTASAHSGLDFSMGYGTAQPVGLTANRR